MKLTIQAYNKEISIETKGDDLTLDDIFTELIIPLLTSIGYSGVEKFLKEYED